jgi:2,3-bisphosphoglycerate-dependent phosphoglycerate mutase
VRTNLNWVGLLRHGQSTGNVSREDAEARGLQLIDIAERDADVPLTELGRQQAADAGKWLARHPPDVVVTSPYLRAAETARIAMNASTAYGLVLAGALVVDERLRDRELGVLDLHTSRGVDELWPEESRRKRRLGKWYYRPPGGESWVDVVLRLRSILADLSSEYPGRRVLLVAHEMTVFALRYLLEGLSEQEVLGAAADTEIANGSVTGWHRGEHDLFSLTTRHEIGHLDVPATTPTDDDVTSPRS